MTLQRCRQWDATRPTSTSATASVIAIWEVVADVNHFVPNSRWVGSPSASVARATVSLRPTSLPPARSVIHWPEVQNVFVQAASGTYRLLIADDHIDPATARTTVVSLAGTPVAGDRWLLDLTLDVADTAHNLLLAGVPSSPTAKGRQRRDSIRASWMQIGRAHV